MFKRCAEERCKIRPRKRKLVVRYCVVFRAVCCAVLRDKWSRGGWHVFLRLCV